MRHDACQNGVTHGLHLFHGKTEIGQIIFDAATHACMATLS